MRTPFKNYDQKELSGNYFRNNFVASLVLWNCCPVLLGVKNMNSYYWRMLSLLALPDLRDATGRSSWHSSRSLGVCASLQETCHQSHVHSRKACKSCNAVLACLLPAFFEAQRAPNPQPNLHNPRLSRLGVPPWSLFLSKLPPFRGFFP